MRVPFKPAVSIKRAANLLEDCGTQNHNYKHQLAEFRPFFQQLLNGFFRLSGVTAIKMKMPAIKYDHSNHPPDDKQF